MIPASVGILHQLPLTPNGKVNRQILEEGGDWRAEQTAYVAPSTRMERLIAGIWEGMLGVRPIGLNHNFFDLGGHSLLAVRVLARLRDATGRSIPVAAIFQAPTVGLLAQMLEEGSAQIAATALLELQRGGQRPRLYLVPGAGGSVGDFTQLVRGLGNDQPVWGFHSAGAPASETSVDEIAQAYLDQLLALKPSEPYLLGGWSFGALIAFEMACRLEAIGRSPGYLVLLDMVAPPLDGLAIDSAALLAALANEITRGAAQVTAEELQELPQQAMLSHIVDRVVALNLLSDIPRDALTGWLSGYARRLRAAAAYRPGFYGGQVVLFRADKPITDKAGFAEQRKSQNPAMGWEQFCRQQVRVHAAGGSHYSMLDPPYVDHLSTEIRALIDRGRILSSAGSSRS
jgi:thioesterase domain-containing protein